MSYPSPSPCAPLAFLPLSWWPCMFGRFGVVYFPPVVLLHIHCFVPQISVTNVLHNRLYDIDV